MKILINILLVTLSFFSNDLLKAQTKTSNLDYKITQEEIGKFVGNWKGELTYLDYSSGKPYSMPCNLSVVRKRDKLQLKYNYPNEPKANSKGKVKFSNHGREINGDRITWKAINSKGQVEIHTEKFGKDGNEGRIATIRNIYKIGGNKMVIRKEVKFDKSEEWIMRNEYSFIRV